VPFFLVGALLTPLALLDSPFYAAAFWAQVAFYTVAAGSLAKWGNLHRTRPGRIALYFSSVNAAILTAWCRYWAGARQELWTPSQR
jgi:hypothetical protein